MAMEERKHTISDKLIRFLTYISLAVGAAAFMLAFSLWTSPINKNWYGCDASFFTLVGRGMLAGKVPYRDFYDLKGPYFFFIEALGQLISRGHVGIYALQTVALFSSLVLIYKFARLYIPHKKALGVIVFFLLAYISLLWGGNCLEEFPLPLNLLAVYLNFSLFMIQARWKHDGCDPEGNTAAIDNDTPEHLFGDSLRLRQVLFNLLSNAVKFTENGSISLHASGIRKSPTEVLLTFVISDTGLGIHNQDLEKIFMPFERSDILINRHIPGAGLGLTLVKDILNIMNGSISVKSVYGKGSAFTVKAAQKISSDSMTFGDYQAFISKQNISPEIIDTPNVWPDARILVVDDTPVNLVVAKGMLKNSEAHVDTCESGEQALELIKANHYDIVFLDHKMPGMDGVETLHKAKEFAGDTKFVALTANNNSNSRQEYIALGFDDYLPKPFKQNELMKVLNACLKA